MEKQIRFTIMSIYLIGLGIVECLMLWDMFNDQMLMANFMFDPFWTFILSFLIPVEALLILGVKLILRTGDRWNSYIMNELYESTYLWLLLIPPFHLHLGIYCLIIKPIFIGGKYE